MKGRTLDLQYLLLIVGQLVSLTTGSNILVFSVEKNKVGEGKIKPSKPFPSCPIKRPTPALKILTRPLPFPDENCSWEDNDGLENESNTKTVPCGLKLCRKEFNVEIGTNNSQHALSILFHYKCPKNMSRIMGVFQWQAIAMEIKCGSGNIHKMSIYQNDMMYSYDMGSQEGDIHAIIHAISNAKTQPVLPTVRVKGKPQKYSNKASSNHEESRIPQFAFGYKPRIGSSNEEPVPFSGFILAADIIHEPFDPSVLDKEAQYMSQVLLGMPYPECLCPGLSTIEDPETRHRHTCPERDIQLTENGSQNIILRFRHPAFVTEIEIMAKTVVRDIYQDAAGNKSTLITQFPTLEQPIDTNGKSIWNSTWKSGRNIDPVITRNLEIEADDNEIYSVLARGWYLQDEGDYDHCFCFPGNSEENGTCDNCGQCKCRKDIDILQAGKSCKPYILNISPRFGPVSGNIKVTISGGLLLPQFHTSSNVTTVNFGGNWACHDATRRDDFIICRVGPGHTSALTLPTPVTVVIDVGGVKYEIESTLNFTYRPDPLITNITPRKGFSIGGQNITINGKYLDSFPVGEYRNALLIFLKSSDKEPYQGNCIITHAEEMTCQIPEIKANTTVSAALIFVINGFEIKNYTSRHLRKFNIFQMPKFTDSGNLYSHDRENLLDLKGEGLNLCCEKADYKVFIGDSECIMVDLFNDTLQCRLSQTDTTDSLIPIKVKVLGHTLLVGHIYYSKSDYGNRRLIVGATVPLVLVGLILMLVLYLKRKGIFSSKIFPWRRNKISIEAHAWQDPLKEDSNDLLDDFGPSMKGTIEDMIIDIKNIDKYERIGRGNSGAVYRGRLVLESSFREVALKTLKDGRAAAKEDLKEFMEEATIMKGFDHPNVVSLIGVAMNKRDLYVVLPYMQNGDLRTYISKQEFNAMKFACFALDISRGMEYLSDHKFVHRDLAARNCMVDDKERVYIGDFGLARDIYQKDYYRPEERQRPLPFKWMAPESIEDQTFTSKSDMWALGVVLWEIYSRGARPYPHVENFYLFDYLRDGYRLTKPRNCPEFIFDLMRLCWEENPDDRPTFKTIVSEISKFTTPSDETSNDYLQPVNKRLTSQQVIVHKPMDSNSSKNTDSLQRAHISAAESVQDYLTYKKGYKKTHHQSSGSGACSYQDIRPPTGLTRARPSSLLLPRTISKGDSQYLAECHPCLTLEAMEQLGKQSVKVKRSRSFHAHRIQDLQPRHADSKNQGEDITGGQQQEEESLRLSAYQAWGHRPKNGSTASTKNESESVFARWDQEPIIHQQPQVQSEGVNILIDTDCVELKDPIVRLRADGTKRSTRNRLSLSISQELFEGL